MLLPIILVAQITPSSYNSNWSYGEHHQLLNVGQTWTGSIEQLMTFQSSIVVTVYSDKASAIDGIEVRQGHHSGLWQSINKFTYNGGRKDNSFTVPVYYKYIQVAYTNGSESQDTMELTTQYYYYPMNPITGDGYLKNKLHLEISTGNNNNNVQSPFDYSKFDTLISIFKTVKTSLDLLNAKKDSAIYNMTLDLQDGGYSYSYSDSLINNIDSIYVPASQWIKGDICTNYEILFSHDKIVWERWAAGFLPIPKWTLSEYPNKFYIKRFSSPTRIWLRINYK